MFFARTRCRSIEASNEGSFDSATAGSGNVVNEVVVLYNGFGQAIETFQSHAGAVNLSTTPSVQMSYADGSANTIRPTGITYPDGRNFRIVGKSFDGGTLEEMRHYYFTDSWQCLEERIDSSTDPERQHVWGIRYIDDLALRDRDTTGNGTLDERLYFLPDANWNVTAVVDDSGAVRERIEYTPYGRPQFLSPTNTTSSISWSTSRTWRIRDPRSTESIDLVT